MRRSVPAEHACFVRCSDIGKPELSELTSSRVVRSVKREGEFYRIAFQHPTNPFQTREILRMLTGKGGRFDQLEIPTFEGHVDPVRRWLTDNPVEIQRPRRCYLDIESDSRMSFDRRFEARMLCWAVEDADTGETFTGLLDEDTDEDEERLLRELWTVLARFDQVVAWAGDWFDFPYLGERTRRRSIGVDARRWLWLDHLILFRRMNTTSSQSGEEKQSMALDAVARIIVGRGKLEFRDEEELDEEVEEEERKAPSLGSQSWELWAGGPAKRELLVRYCLNDVDLMSAIEGKTGYIELLFTVCDVCSTFPDTRGISPANQVDGFLLRLAHERGMRARTKRFDENAEQFKGAFNLDPAIGLHTEPIHVCDFAGMYPSIIISFNMSPETLRPDVILKEDITYRPSYLSHLPAKTYPIPEGHCAAAITDKVFSLEKRGILPEALVRVRKLREEWNKKRSTFVAGTPEFEECDRRATAYKVVANCFYGVVSSPFSAFFERAVGESTAQTGVWLIQKTADAARERGWRVIYIDTDALYVVGPDQETFEAFVEWCNTELYPALLASRKCTENLVKLEYEKAFARMVIVRKKRYIGRYLHYKKLPSDKIEIKGLEFKRGDSVRLARQLQQSVAYRLLGHECEQSEKAEDFESYVESYARKVFEEPLEMADVKRSKKLTKAISDYVRKTKNTPPMHKLLGEDVSILFTDYECSICDSMPTNQLSVRAMKCEQPDCGGKLRKKRNSATGTVTKYLGDRLAVTGDRRTQIAFIDSIDSITCFSKLGDHVQVAKQMQTRGMNVRAGVLIEYVTTDDGPKSLDEWSGEVDRYQLWKDVFDPTMRLLEAAFPRHQWTKFRRDKPATFTMPTGQRVSVPRKVVPKKLPPANNQGSLF